MKTEDIEKIVNEKILKLFYKLIELNPIKISDSSFFYKLNGEVIELGISKFENNKNDGYKFPELHRCGIFSFPGSLSSFTVSDKWGFYINLPQCEADREYYHSRQLKVPAFEEIELLNIKKKLLLKQQEFELTLLDKYLKNPDDLPF